MSSSMAKVASTERPYEAMPRGVRLGGVGLGEWRTRLGGMWKSDVGGRKKEDGRLPDVPYVLAFHHTPIDSSNQTKN